MKEGKEQTRVTKKRGEKKCVCARSEKQDRLHFWSAYLNLGIVLLCSGSLLGTLGGDLCGCILLLLGRWLGLCGLLLLDKLLGSVDHGVLAQVLKAGLAKHNVGVACWALEHIGLLKDKQDVLGLADGHTGNAINGHKAKLGQSLQ